MEKLFKIKSITDVITNSSTEVFQCYGDKIRNHVLLPLMPSGRLIMTF